MTTISHLFWILSACDAKTKAQFPPHSLVLGALPVTFLGH